MRKRKPRRRKPEPCVLNENGEILIRRKMEVVDGKAMGYVAIPISEWAKCLKL